MNTLKLEMHVRTLRKSLCPFDSPITKIKLFKIGTWMQIEA